LSTVCCGGAVCAHIEADRIAASKDAALRRELRRLAWPRPSEWEVVRVAPAPATRPAGKRLDDLVLEFRLVPGAEQMRAGHEYLFVFVNGHVFRGWVVDLRFTWASRQDNVLVKLHDVHEATREVVAA
jgi:hypothetical protein